MKHRFLLLAIVFLSIAVYAQAPAPAEQAIRPPDSLVLDGIPPIPAELATTTLRYTEYRSAGILDWHPRERQNADRHALRRCAASPPGEVSGWRPHAAHVLS